MLKNSSVFLKSFNKENTFPLIVLNPDIIKMISLNILYALPTIKEIISELDNKEDKILKSFLIGNPMNIGLKLNLQDTDYHIIKGYKSKIDAISRFNSNKKTLCSNISPVIFFSYSGLNENQKIISVLSNVSVRKLVETLPFTFNQIEFKNIYFKDNILTNFNQRFYNSFLLNIRNYWDLQYFPWNNNDFIVIREYIKKIKNKNNLINI